MNNKRILIADDEANLLRSVSFILTKAGYEVITAANGEEALQKAQEIKPAIIFLDIMMPKKNGYEVCEAVRKLDGTTGTYILFLTAKGGMDDREKALHAGANDIMTKPFSQSELVLKVKSIIENSTGS
jgi:DNA-binding response OmpR family regulator